MGNPFIGEIRMFGGNFAPAGWAFCDGQLLPISENDALFALIGTTYGGDGRTTFGLPDLRGRIPIHAGSGPGLSPRQLGQQIGSEEVTITVNQLPGHTHTVRCDNNTGNQQPPASNVWAANATNQYSSAAPTGNLNAQAIQNTGGSQPHDNLMPALCVHFIISLFGIFPSPS